MPMINSYQNKKTICWKKACVVIFVLHIYKITIDLEEKRKKKKSFIC